MTAFDDHLAREQIVRIFFLRVGDCTGLLGATVVGITDAGSDLLRALDRQAGNSGGACGR